MNDKERQRAD